jgi:FtsP/CotA-like multicopper oxidase with cupredoxin domain
MTPKGTVVLAVVVALGIAAAMGTALYLSEFHGGTTTSGGKVQDFQIIASIDGFNGSALPPCAVNGVPQIACPVLHVSKGAFVNITVKNTDKQAHGFQVTHYFDNTIEVIAPGQSLNVSFVANEAGTFKIYCDIPCSIHWAMQSGELVVS